MIKEHLSCSLSPGSCFLIKSFAVLGSTFLLVLQEVSRVWYEDSSSNAAFLFPTKVGLAMQGTLLSLSDSDRTLNKSSG